MTAVVPVVFRSAVEIVPEVVLSTGTAGRFAWEEFFSAQLRNPRTRKAYRHAVMRFLNWLEPSGVGLAQVTPGMVGQYFDRHSGSIPTRKLHLAALRSFFDVMCRRHVCLLNPASSVRGERYAAVEGKTPEISVEQAQRLLKSIRTDTVVGKRDKAIIAVLIYTAARAGAVAQLTVGQFIDDGSQYVLRFEHEKGGKSREIPVRHDLQLMLLDYVEVSRLNGQPKDTPFFQTAISRSDKLTGKAMTGIDIGRMLKRRLRDAGLPSRLSPHSFRVATVTNLLEQNVPLEDVQFLAGHSDPRTTRLYDRRKRKITRNVVERISI
jgi:integrase/recombinase XerD